MDFSAADAGLAYAAAGHLLDTHDKDVHVHVHVDAREEPTPVLINAAEGSPFIADWDGFVGQEKVKTQLRTYIAAAKEEKRALEHVLLASGFPGVGKTTLARLIAEEMGGQIIMLVPPFSLPTLVQAAVNLPAFGVLFIDEIHKLMDLGTRGPEMLLHLLEEKRLYLDDGVTKLNDITVIGATTDRDLLPETIIDRFEIKPFFDRYDRYDMDAIVTQFEVQLGVDLPVETTIAIAKASQGIPRKARDLVKGARAIAVATGTPPTPAQLLSFKEIDPDGLEANHREYLAAMFKSFGRINSKGKREYVAGEMSMATLLRETKQGIGRIERFLIERGMLDRTPSGRKLTPKGIERARAIVGQR